jgi:hypothetical protein
MDWGLILVDVFLKHIRSPCRHVLLRENSHFSESISCRRRKQNYYQALAALPGGIVSACGVMCREIGSLQGIEW